METSMLSTAKAAVKNWWISLLVGLLFVLLGIWMLIQPASTYEALVVFFSALMFVSGFFEIIMAISNSSKHGWGWYLVIGIIDLILGTFLIANPDVTALIIPFIIALWLMFRGVSTIGFATDLQTMGVKGWGWYVFLGVLAIIFSIFIIWNPFTGAAIAVYMTALAMLFIGIFRMCFALALRKVGRLAKN